MGEGKGIIMKIIWLGQAGLLFIKDDFKIMIDPYLSDSVKKINPKNYRRVAAMMFQALTFMTANM